MSLVSRHVRRARLAGAFAFLGFSTWLVLAPLVAERLDRRTRPYEPIDEILPQALGPRSDLDLLARHGSFAKDAPGFRDPFAWIPDPTPGAGPGSGGAPGQGGDGGEPGGETGGDGEEVPALVVTLVFRADKAARAVVDGRIVGVGDESRAGTIVEILDGGVWTQRLGKKRFFALSPR